MRLKKGDLVEVLSKKEISSGSWSCAEIISGNGHTYSVRYCSYLMAREELVDRVPRKAIRPCPPAGEGPDVWVAGDLAEVYHNYSWKQAKITKMVGDDSCIARILGSPLDVMISQSHMRKRQAWHDGKWFVLGKGPEVSGSLSRKRQTSARIKPDNVEAEDQQPGVLTTSTRQLKRALLIESPDSEAHKVSIQKRKVTEKGVRSLPPQESHRIGLNLPFLTGNTEVSTGDVGLREKNRIPGTLNHIRSDSCASSVGSTGTTDDFSGVPYISIAHCIKNVEGEDYCSDAESFAGQGQEGVCSCSSEEVLARNHSLIISSAANGTSLEEIWVLSLVVTWNNLKAPRASKECQDGAGIYIWLLSLNIIMEYHIKVLFQICVWQAI